MFPTLKHFGVGIIPWSPLAKGLLTRPFKGDETTARGDNARWVYFVPAAPSDAIRASSWISDYLEGPGTVEILNRSVAPSGFGNKVP
jgi:aryl-alcohol dehydrogenase-like predicted oxidoreductase